MPKGRKPKPAAQKRREGNPGKRAIAEDAKVGKPGKPAMPAGLPTESQTAWRQICKVLEDSNMLRTADASAIEAFAIAIGRGRIARKELAAYRGKHKSIYTTGSTGQLVEHPALGTERQAMKEVRYWTDYFGFNPSARQRLGAGGEKGRDVNKAVADKIGKPPALKALPGGKSS